MLDAVAHIAICRVGVHDGVEVTPYAVFIILEPVIQIFVHDVERKGCAAEAEQENNSQ